MTIAEGREAGTLIERWFARARVWVEPRLPWLQRIWRDDRIFYPALVLFNLYLTRNTFRDGIWADNDSVCHYAYLRHLLEDFYPATGTFFGWTPKYDLGAPFLVYNTPPGIYVFAAILAKVIHLSALMALKVEVVLAFLAVPLLGAALARTFEDERDDPARDLPKFTALALSLYSSELFGLEFYFKNGMLNPAVAVPLAMATLLCLRRAQRAEGARALRWVACGALGFGATVFVHLLTAYMLALSLGCFALAGGLRRFGRSVLQVGVILGLGAGLAAFWLVPSMPFAAKTDAAYTWIRRPLDTLSVYLDGSALSSYFVGFFPHFFTFSAVGLVPIVCAGFAVGFFAVRRTPAIGAVILTAVLAVAIAMGPEPSFGLFVLPMYDRLLWFRFMTLATLMTFLLAAWGAWRLWGWRAKLGPAFYAVVVLAVGWSIVVVTGRAYKITTASEGKSFVADVDSVAAWVRDHGKPGGRVYSEFLAENIVDTVSVNYTRHMMPILSGYPEAGGWVYENDEAAQVEMRRGLFWYDPFPIVALAERYDVQYVVAGSPNLVRALASDPRWRLVLGTPHVSLFEAVGREPSLVSAAGYDARLVSQRYLEGGGYEYVVHVDPRPETGATPRLHLKTSWSPAWTARTSAGPLTVTRDEDALLDVDLLAGGAPADVTLTWDITALRARGNRVSFLALAALALLAGAGFSLRTAAPPIAAVWVERIGVAGAAIALVVLVLRAHPVDEDVVGFGVRGGILPTFDSKRAEVGAFDDAIPGRLTRVAPEAWGGGELLGTAPARRLLAPGRTAAHVTLAPGAANRITVRGEVRGLDGAARDDAPIVLTLRDAGGTARCTVHANLGVAVDLPAACGEGPPGEGPGIDRALALEADGTLVASSLDVDDGVVVVEAESMHNALDDSGYEAFYTMGRPNELRSNGVSMKATAGYEIPIALDRDVALPAPRYAAWLLMPTMPARLAKGLANVLLETDGETLADFAPESRHPLEYWGRDATWEWLPAGELDGAGTRRVRVTFYKTKSAFAGTADLDAMAFVPIARDTHLR
ncbi:MAG TPA: 6-pyruvoyl-tetrahydropterin synthase-related protein [Polyangiaceae bacterium]|jgi:hypothetical protein|nr:6-pyruvoyl-tetrahydropterin synthase-related protein [Polyangiaceae bacterium]